MHPKVLAQDALYKLPGKEGYQVLPMELHRNVRFIKHYRGEFVREIPAGLPCRVGLSLDEITSFSQEIQVSANELEVFAAGTKEPEAGRGLCKDILYRTPDGNFQVLTDEESRKPTQTKPLTAPFGAELVGEIPNGLPYHTKLTLQDLRKFHDESRSAFRAFNLLVFLPSSIEQRIEQSKKGL